MIKTDSCRLCIFQRDGNLSNIVYRTITGQYRGAEEDTFGHCFFCLSCNGISDIPCYGWWPLDPDGGDFVGDEGSLHPDAKESWTSAQCFSLSEERSESLMNMLDSYAEEHRYHVLNWGGTSCLGFCEDIVRFAQKDPTLVFGDFTISGDFRIKGAAIYAQNSDNTSASIFMQEVLKPQISFSYGNIWNREYHHSTRKVRP